MIAERVDGLPSRLWQYTASPQTSRRHSTTVSAFASDRLAIGSRGALDVALRYESLRAAAQSPETQPVPPVETVYLIAEIIPGSTKTERALLGELEESARYLRQFVPEGGLELTV